MRKPPVGDASETHSLETDPLTHEFAATVGVRRVSGSFDVVASSIPEADATPVVVLGSSRTLVVDTIEGLIGRGDRPDTMPQGERWAYLGHLDSESPNYILIGISKWEQESELAIAMQGLLKPVCLLILDSKSPNVLDARRLITAVPDEWRKAVVVLVGVDTENLEGAGTVLTNSLRRLFRIPVTIPMTVSGSITTEASRTWLYDLMEAHPPGEHAVDEARREEE